MNLVQVEETLSASWAEEANFHIKGKAIPFGEGGPAGQLNKVDRVAYSSAVGRVVRPEWVKHEAYRASNGRIDKDHNVELHLLAQPSHSVLT